MPSTTNPQPSSKFFSEQSAGPMTQPSFVRRELTVNLDNGLHIVPCSAIAKLAREHTGTVRIVRGEIVADAASVFDLLGLNAQKGTILMLEADGDGADAILDRLEELFASGFDVQR
jgi:phosphotransferase system HPr (HPr) family protein